MHNGKFLSLQGRWNSSQRRHAKLTAQQVRAIRLEAKVWRTPVWMLAARYDVHPETVRDVLARRTWVDV